MNNPLLQLKPLGQSLWYDNIDRAQLVSGQFQHLLDDDGVVGVTANPTTFEKAMSQGHAYDEQLQQLSEQHKSVKEICETLITTDIRTVAQALRPIYHATGGQDGFVSLEVSPALAADTKGTLEEARRFWSMIACPNLMIKIPATPQGITAIHQALVEGINVNVTLIFSLEDYRRVTEAYVSALEARVQKNQDITSVASVASFFVSRLDVLVDSLLENKIQATDDPDEQHKLRALRGKAAIANARLVYQAFRDIFSTPRFAVLARKGGHMQRPLWASTSTKNPAYRDVLYAEELIGPNTVDTMPLATIENFRDHGRPHLSIENDLDQAKVHFAALEQVGISYQQVTEQLLQEGVHKFADSFQSMYQGTEKKEKELQAGKETRF
jgi:transaldolase